ncbi:2-dehydropantoate 2-reductase [Roseomonas sp. OT10]|uniref:ketopantoate reductase family protein n=1 Tax=Roseomonas cutis TaxID=2897332 RepID=UPI001E3E8898|nr:2-dehydropantoate 2-reductase [Roseomonas sp. OT10]UFN50620.1 2-dehydropantoate 2-reductase [Roseomonas sp. OT10]
MKICIYGAGAIGGHLAARLAKGGAEVSVVARGAQLAAIRERGLTVRAPDGDLHCRPAASDDPAALGPQDAVIVTVKAPSLPQVAQGIGPLLREDTAVAFVMNGIPWWYFDHHGGSLEGRRLPELDPGDAVRTAVGLGRTVGGVVYSACTVIEPGVIVTEHANNRVFLGRPDGGPSPQAEGIAAALRGGGFTSKVVDDIRREIWAKLLGNLTSGPICVLTRHPLLTALEEPAIVAARSAIAREGVAITKALGLELPAETMATIEGFRGSRHKPSILQDLELGRPMEVDALLNVPLQLARMAKVETPTLDLLVAMVRKVAESAGLYRPAA